MFSWGTRLYNPTFRLSNHKPTATEAAATATVAAATATTTTTTITG